MAHHAASSKTPPMRLALSQILRHQGKTQQELADALGIDQGTVSRYVNNRVLPRRKRLAEIASALNLRPSDLFEDGTVDAFDAELMDLFPYLSEEDKDDLLALARAKAARHRRDDAPR